MCILHLHLGIIPVACWVTMYIAVCYIGYCYCKYVLHPPYIKTSQKWLSQLIWFNKCRNYSNRLLNCMRNWLGNEYSQLYIEMLIPCLFQSSLLYHHHSLEELMVY